MRAMRTTLLGLMMFLMLTPILTCAMTFCPMQSAQAAGSESCHDMEDEGAEPPMFSIDCMGIDLFQQDTNHDFQPDLVLTSIDPVWSDLVADYNFRPEYINSIRGPPDKFIEPRGQPSIILNTQRFRI